ncbi:MAG: hypothetical protein ACE5ED_06085 [Rhodothalassiaceae bacterium]
MKRIVLLSVVFAVPALLVSATGHAQGRLSRDYLAEYLTCDRFSMPRERLACFEAILKLYKLETGRLSGTPDDLVAAERATPALPPGAGAAAGSGAGTAAGTRSAAIPPQQTRIEGIPERFSARIVRIWKPNPRSKYYFKLDNGMIWRQSSGPWVKIAENETGPVEIFRGRFGGWRMKVEGHTGLSFVAPVK